MRGVEPRFRARAWLASWLAVTCAEEVVMGLFSKDIKSMEDLFVHGLQDLYYAENKIAKSLPTMIDKASDGELKRGFEMQGRDARGEKCPAIDGIIREAEDVMGEVEDQDVLNSAIIAAAQAVEHYEITRYGALIAWATELGHRDAAKILGESLKEEKATDAKLTAIAERKLNPRADAKTDTGRARKKRAGARKKIASSARGA